MANLTAKRNFKFGVNINYSTTIRVTLYCTTNFYHMVCVLITYPEALEWKPVRHPLLYEPLSPSYSCSSQDGWQMNPSFEPFVAPVDLIVSPSAIRSLARSFGSSSFSPISGTGTELDGRCRRRVCQSVLYFCHVWVSNVCVEFRDVSCDSDCRVPN